MSGVFINKSKIHFESKSQHFTTGTDIIGRCLSISQRYILKANHNLIRMETIQAKVFINKSKIHFESKSQHKQSGLADQTRCLSISQRYILKANHNTYNSIVDLNKGVYQ